LFKVENSRNAQRNWERNSIRDLLVDSEHTLICMFEIRNTRLSAVEGQHPTIPIALSTSVESDANLCIHSKGHL